MRTSNACFLLTLLVSARATASIIYVDDSAPLTGANDGSSWQNAFLDLQDALAIAKAGDEIRVAQGAYKPAPPNGPHEATFNVVNGLTLQGGYAGFGASDPDTNDPVKFETMLSGDLNGNDGPTLTTMADNSYHVVMAINVDDATVLRGLTIMRGNAFFETDCSGGEIPEQSAGGGLWCDNASFLMEDCVIRNNRASCFGGGMRIAGGAATFRRCEFRANAAGQGDVVSSGGGMTCSGAHSFVDCQFVGNFSVWGSGGARAGGGTVFRSCLFQGNDVHEANGAIGGGDFALINCVVDGNHSGTFFAGVNAENVLIVNCTFTGHTSFCTGGGTTLNVRANSLVLNSVFTGNKAPVVGVQGSAAVVNCTITGNLLGCDGAVYVANGHANVMNSVLWNNTEDSTPTENDELILSTNGSAKIFNTCIRGWTGSLGGVGNHGNDPNFIDADGPDNMYGTADDNPRLRANSPCIDSGDMLLLPADTFDLDEDGDITEPLPIDLDGLPRVVGANVDSGAFEFQGIPCRADIDGDGAVDVDDLITVILAWGACEAGNPCPADLNLNMQVEVDDLLAVLLQWGACP